MRSKNGKFRKNQIKCIGGQKVWRLVLELDWFHFLIATYMVFVFLDCGRGVTGQTVCPIRFSESGF